MGHHGTESTEHKHARSPYCKRTHTSNSVHTTASTVPPSPPALRAHWNARSGAPHGGNMRWNPGSREQRTRGGAPPRARTQTSVKLTNMSVATPALGTRGHPRHHHARQGHTSMYTGQGGHNTGVGTRVGGTGGAWGQHTRTLWCWDLSSFQHPCARHPNDTPRAPAHPAHLDSWSSWCTLSKKVGEAVRQTWDEHAGEGHGTTWQNETRCVTLQEHDATVPPPRPRGPHASSTHTRGTAGHDTVVGAQHEGGDRGGLDRARVGT
jgi:hypothetical protein